jgi:hypothetical protein
MALSDDVKALVSLREVVEALAEPIPRLSAPGRGEWFYRCPMHGGDSFHVTEKGGERGRWYCHGCQAGGSVIDLVMALDGVSFGEAVKRLAAEHGVGTAPPPASLARDRCARAEAAARRAEAETRRAEARAHDRARAIWREARPVQDAAGALLCEYLAARLGGALGMPCPPPTLRVAPELRAGAEPGAHRGPAMVAAVGRGRLVGVHRTWITPRGRARDRAGETVPKMMLGPCYGHPVRLTPADPETVLLVGEGIETTLAALLSVRRALAEGRRPPIAWGEGWPAAVTAEAALSLGALAGPGRHPGPAPSCNRTGRPLPARAFDRGTERPGWVPPEGHLGPVVILADPSPKSPEAARRMASRAVDKLAALRPGLEVRLAVPRGHYDHADDFADLAARGEL